MTERERLLHRQTLMLLREVLNSKNKSRYSFDDWKDADDWLFAELDFTKDELIKIFTKDDMVYISSAKEGPERDTLFASPSWFRYLTGKEGNTSLIGYDQKGFPNAGPNPNIEGMRRIYGKDAYLVMCDRYLFHVDRATYELIQAEG